MEYSRKINFSESLSDLIQMIELFAAPNPGMDGGIEKAGC